jgi:hypothetical protein
MAITIIREPSSSAGQTAEFNVDKLPIKVSLYPVADLTATEYADLQERDPAGTFGDVWDAFYQGTGAQVRLESTIATSIVISATGTYRLDFDNPTNSVGAFIEAVEAPV